MKYNMQLIEHNPSEGEYGDCYRTAISCVLDKEPSEVPHFYNLPHEDVNEDLCWKNINAYLADIGLNMMSLALDSKNMDMDHALSIGSRLANGMLWFLSGSNGASNHVVICQNDEIIHNTSRIAKDISEPCLDETWQIEVIVRDIYPAPSPLLEQ